jgi:hypothetical protein
MPSATATVATATFVTATAYACVILSTTSNQVEHDESHQV